MTRKKQIGVEIGSDGLPHGVDPRRMTQDELRQMGHEPMSAQAALRAHCLDCCAGSSDEVRKCMALACPSWAFRMGKSPWKEKRVVSDAQREAMLERPTARCRQSERSGLVRAVLVMRQRGNEPASTPVTPDHSRVAAWKAARRLP